MQTTASQRLLARSLPADASVAEGAEAVVLQVKRGTIEVVVTVPRTVREWFVKATDTSSGARAEDWCDYDGYDDSSEESRDLEMAEDVSRFAERLLSRELRFEAGRRNKLMWKAADSWLQAVPLDGSAI